VDEDEVRQCVREALAEGAQSFVISGESPDSPTPLNGLHTCRWMRSGPKASLSLGALNDKSTRGAGFVRRRAPALLLGRYQQFPLSGCHKGPRRGRCGGMA
jgi:hypothetical protein